MKNMHKYVSSKPVSSKNVNITDPFWVQYIDLVRNTVIPYQWDALNDRIADAEPSHAVKNFKIAAGLEEGEFHGFVFQDSDVAKWLEAVGYSLETHPDEKLEAIADGIIDVMEKAQQKDGYLDTYFIIKEPDKRWTNLCECHELYVAGHLIEAAVAYYRGTGKRKLLDIACRFADHIDKVFGPEPGKIHGYAGHQEIELALVKLYEVTGNERYLNLSKYFIDERGKEPNYFYYEWEHIRNQMSIWTGGRPAPKPDLKYHQAHKPVREQEEAVGHAVRAVYMYSGMADVARETGNLTLLEACRRLWKNIVSKQMYITGGIGSTHHGEAFSFDYDLPNDTIYAETCASLGLIFFAHRMLKMEPDSIYADVMERAMYNTVLSAMSRDGKHFFYVNPMEVWPEASQKNPGKNHIKPVRQKWFGCACCPPNLARFISSLNQYIYSFNDDTIYTHLYISSETEIACDNGSIRINQESRYPWHGDIKVRITSSTAEKPISMALRIPGWCRQWSVKINGEPWDAAANKLRGYVVLKRRWQTGDEIELNLEMPIEIIQANPRVRADTGKVAIQRGPLVYCLEQADNGENLHALSIDPHVPMTVEADDSLCEGCLVIKGRGKRLSEEGWEDALYRPVLINQTEVAFKAIPYFLWGNRSPGEMQVWIRLN